MFHYSSPGAFSRQATRRSNAKFVYNRIVCPGPLNFLADASDGTTLLKFRRLLEKHKLGAALFAQVNETLESRGLKVGTSTIVDATIIGAAGSTKNVEKARDPEMRQTRKRQQWYFGMKLHIGVDSRTGLTHSAVVTAANAHDKHALADLLHGEERRVYGDSAYASQKELIGGHALRRRTSPISVRTPTRLIAGTDQS